MVFMIPISRITSAIILKHFWIAVQELSEIGFHVVSSTADNHSANRKAFLELLGGNWGSSIPNPYDNNLPIFLIFDPTHNVKNFYNNLVNKKWFDYPTDDGDITTCSLQYIENLIESEERHVLKLVPHLLKRHINPNNLDRLSTRPALSVINTKTVAALDFYRIDHPEWAGTSYMLEKVVKVWNIMNVKTPVAGKMKRNVFMDPIRHENDFKLEVLESFNSFVQNWQDGKLKGLTRETFIAWHQTLNAVVGCAKYLLRECGFHFVLLGQLQSDPIEERFGWYRQMHGANYYVSVRQLFESERKLRAICLTKFSQYSLDEISSFQSNSDHNVNSDDFISFVMRCSIPEPDQYDLNAIFYVAGALSYSETKMRRCSSCQDFLITSSSINVPDCVESCVKNFTEQISRSGLSHPSRSCFEIIQKLWELVEILQSDDEIFSRFVRIFYFNIYHFIKTN